MGVGVDDCEWGKPTYQECGDIHDKKCDEINYRYQGETHFFPRLFIEATIFADEREKITSDVE